MTVSYVLGFLFVGLGTLSILIALAIAVRDYLLSRPKNLFNVEDNDIKLLELVRDLLKTLLTAPPPFFFFILGVSLLVGGAWVLAKQPL